MVRLIWIMARKAPSGPSKEDTKDMTSDDSKVEPGIPGHDGVPVKGSDGDTTARIPELGCVDGKWTVALMKCSTKVLMAMAKFHGVHIWWLHIITNSITTTICLNHNNQAKDRHRHNSKEYHS